MKYSNLFYELKKSYKVFKFLRFFHCPAHSSLLVDRYEKMIIILSKADMQEIKALKMYIESEVNGISNLLTVFGIEFTFIIGTLPILSNQNQSDTFKNELSNFINFVLFILILVAIATFMSTIRKNRNQYILLVINEFLNTRGIVAKNK